MGRIDQNLLKGPVEMKYVCFARHPCRHTVATERQQLHLHPNIQLDYEQFQDPGSRA